MANMVHLRRVLFVEVNKEVVIIRKDSPRARTLRDRALERMAATHGLRVPRASRPLEERGHDI